jgi:hypothetical protein
MDVKDGADDMSSWTHCDNCGKAAKDTDLDGWYAVFGPDTRTQEVADLAAFFNAQIIGKRRQEPLEFCSSKCVQSYFFWKDKLNVGSPDS